MGGAAKNAICYLSQIFFLLDSFFKNSKKIFWKILVNLAEVVDWLNCQLNSELSWKWWCSWCLYLFSLGFGGAGVTLHSRSSEIIMTSSHYCVLTFQKNRQLIKGLLLDTLQLQLMNTSAYYTYLLLLLKSVVYFIIITSCVFRRTGICCDGKNSWQRVPEGVSFP